MGVICLAFVRVASVAANSMACSALWDNRICFASTGWSPASTRARIAERIPLVVMPRALSTSSAVFS